MTPDTPWEAAHAAAESSARYETSSASRLSLLCSLVPTVRAGDEDRAYAATTRRTLLATRPAIATAMVGEYQVNLVESALRPVNPPRKRGGGARRAVRSRP